MQHQNVFIRDYLSFNFQTRHQKMKEIKMGGKNRNLFQLIIEISPSAIKIIHLSHSQSPIKSGLSRERELFCFRNAIQKEM